MGCSFYYSGCLKDHKAQEAVVKLAEQCFEGGLQLIVPKPNKTYLTRIGLDTHLLEDGSYTQFSSITDPVCPFDFFGLSPHGNPLEEEGGAQLGQFIFHRCQPNSPAYIEKREGMLVTLELSPWQRYTPPDFDSTEVYEGQLLDVHSGGHFRCSGGGKFSLLLCLIRLRWMPDFVYSDDYGSCESMEELIVQHGLTGKFSRPSISFEECWDIVNHT